ncbi:MAG: YraN family protein [Planctomycetales bacterium]
MNRPRLLDWNAIRRICPPAAREWLAGWLGNAGERAAARFLKKLGYRVIARRHRTPLGELDLVALDGEVIVFVEVKTRRSTDAGHPFEAVDRRKQAQLTRLALAFLKQHGWLERRARFDVVSIVWPEGARHPQITHFRDAFEAVGEGQMFS